ncbi:MAG: large conductance mechanosensitive channel protein MscL [Bacteroidota bacterium]
MSLLKEFREFSIKGNMIDMAIGVVIGAAFNSVLDALVKEIFMPPLSLMTKGLNWENKKLILQDKVVENGSVITEEVAMGYGKLIEVGIDFLVISLTIFLVVKAMNRLRRKADDPQDVTEKTPKDIELLNAISLQLEKQTKILEEISTKN